MPQPVADKDRHCRPCDPSQKADEQRVANSCRIQSPGSSDKFDEHPDTSMAAIVDQQSQQANGSDNNSRTNDLSRPFRLNAAIAPFRRIETNRDKHQRRKHGPDQEHRVHAPTLQNGWEH